MGTWGPSPVAPSLSVALQPCPRPLAAPLLPHPSADADEPFDGASDTIARAVYTALISSLNKGSIWLACGAPEKYLLMLIAATLKDHGLQDATSWKGFEHGSLLAAEQTLAGTGSAGVVQDQARAAVRNVMGGAIGLAVSFKVPEGIEISIHSDSSKR